MTNVRKITAQQFKMLANGRRKVMGDGNVVHCPKSIALEGAPGMGKTAVIRSLGEDWGLPVVTVAINQWCNAADIVGFHYVGHKDEKGVFEIAGEDAIPPWMPVYRVDPVTGDRVKTSDETKGLKVWRDPKTLQTEAHPAIILLDEFSAANPQIQGAFLSVALDKVVKNFKLDNDTNFFIAYNSCERAGFEGQNSEISDALVSCNGRFDPMELVYDWYPVNEAVKKNKNISAFWKSFSTKYLKDLDICNDNVRGDKNSCGRTWESCLVELSNNCFDSKNWNDTAELILSINFATSPEVVKKFISYVKTFDIPTGEDYLSGKVVVKKNFLSLKISLTRNMKPERKIPMVRQSSVPKLNFTWSPRVLFLGKILKAVRNLDLSPRFSILTNRRIPMRKNSNKGGDESLPFSF